MNSLATPRFWQLLNALPIEIQELALKNYALWQKDSTHPSLHFKPVGKYWSVRVSLGYRALARKEGDTYIWFWIGSHDEYERLIG